MLLRTVNALICLGTLLTSLVLAQTPSAAPAGSTGQCRDGSYWTGATKKGACRGHKGVQDWYVADGADANATPGAVVTTPAPAASPSPAPTVGKTTATGSGLVVTSKPPASAPAEQPAPGGGAGQVWVNSSSKVYHCSTDRWYGKTKHGEYMSEADAVTQGNRPDHGKACAK